MLAFPESVPTRGAPSMPDQQVIDEIRARYVRADHVHNPREIAVSAKAGTVTLRGTVSSPNQRRVAAEIAQSVPGVRTVENELVVDPRDHWEDGEIRGAALQALISSPDVPEDDVDVTVANRWLTLRGQVKHQYESDAAFAATSGLPGVGGMTNKIVVVTAGGH
jgi:osmotically-inducible protein OsmY